MRENFTLRYQADRELFDFPDEMKMASTLLRKSLE